MRKSVGSFISSTRRSFLLLGVIVCLVGFGVIVWQVGAKESAAQKQQGPKDQSSQAEQIRPMDDDAYNEAKEKFDYKAFVELERNGLIPSQAGPVSDESPLRQATRLCNAFGARASKAATRAR